MLLSLVISLLFTTINLDLTISEKNFIDPRDKSFDQSINSFSFPDNVNQVLGGLFGSETKGGDEKIQQGEFPWALANTSVWLSASSYCPYSTFLNRTYAGYAEGFVATTVLNTGLYDVQGFIGYMPSQASIYVVFRGSASAEDWVDDFHTKLIPYPPCSDCTVHEGFYTAEQFVLPQILEALRILVSQHSTYQIVVTGHSLGAALATLTAVDLIRNLSQIFPPKHLQLKTSSPIVMINFGSPRVGNLAFAAYTSELLTPSHYRVTHLRDIIPHTPWSERYVHIDGEWYEDEFNQIHPCTGYEDPNCSDQWYITSIDDHMLYLNQSMTCDAVTFGY